MIALLRFIGILNAATWFGAAVFFTFGASPASFSEGMRALLEAKFYPYYSGAIAQILFSRFYGLEIICGVIAFLHLTMEWLYLGKSPRKTTLTLLVAVFSLTLLGGSWLQPRLKQLHSLRHLSPDPQIREAARQSFPAWSSVSQVINLLIISGLIAYLWRLANPPDPTRFLNTAKFHS